MDEKVTRMYLLRIEKGLRQRDVEKMLGITHVIYSAVESGRMGEPWDYVIQKLENFYKTPIEKLLEKVYDDR
jgi:transcriptional regulator with XRE-family HTH domain